MRLLRGCEGGVLRAAGLRSSFTALVMRGMMMIMFLESRSGHIRHCVRAVACRLQHREGRLAGGIFGAARRRR